MQIELNAEEIDLIIDWFDIMTELVGSKEVDEELAGRHLFAHVRNNEPSQPVQVLV